MKFLFLNSFLVFPFQKYQETIEVSKKRLRTYPYHISHSFAALNKMSTCTFMYVCVCVSCVRLATRQLKNYKNHCKEMRPKECEPCFLVFFFAVTNIRPYYFTSSALF